MLTIAGEIQSRKAFALLENTEKKEAGEEHVGMRKDNESPGRGTQINQNSPRKKTMVEAERKNRKKVED